MKRGCENDAENWAGPSGTNDAGCSKRKRDDHELSKDVLDMLEFDSDPPSSDEDDMSACTPVLEPKHEIFLSHSGKQKDFTELLCKELERCGYSPFFDIREDSLPKGKKFPELILSAARQCRVAVLILSEEFFTNTKWPMLELAAFVDAQKKSLKEKRPPVDILPVYFELTREECRKDENVERWQKRWDEMENMEMAEKMKEMDELGKAETQAQCEAAREKGELRSQKWKAAMKVLGPSNGIEYERSSRQAGLIDRVVSAVRGLLPPPTIASDPSTQAKGRICKSLIEMISRTQPSSNGARVVGVYGMGGMGKTTFCKELCCELYQRFEGMVCHAELGRSSEIELQRKVVQRLTNVNHGTLSLADHSKVIYYVRTRMAKEKVFLALDDVWPESKGEAMVYVEQARYGKRSIVMVTARSIDVLLSLGIKESNCFAMPELEEEDARQLFLHHAAPDFHFQGSEDEKCIHHCVKECHFSRGGDGGGHFLPLALKVLGEQLRDMGENPRKWVDSLLKEDKFDLDRKKEHPIFYILGKGYDSLRPEDQLLFMDTILCNPDWKRTFSRPRKMGTLFEWLSIAHYDTTSKESLIRDRLQRLKARALLEDIGDGRCGVVVVHDLYREFAEFEASRDYLDARRVLWHANSKRVVWHAKSTKLLRDLVKTPSGSCWSSMERVGIEYVSVHNSSHDAISVDGVKWQHFANVVVLELQIGVDQVLDLQGLQCLRSLVVKAERSTVIGLEKMRNLGWLDLDGVYCGSGLSEIGRLTELQMLRVKGYCSSASLSRDLKSGSAGVQLNLEKCINLRELVVECRCLHAVPDLGGMKNLRKVHLECPDATEVLGGFDSQSCALQELVLKYFWSLGNRWPKLLEVEWLQELEVEELPRYLQEFPDIRTLTRLRILTIRLCWRLELIPALGQLVALEYLKFNTLPCLRELPNMRLLTKLRKIELYVVPTLWGQLRLLDMVPSQIRYFTPKYRSCDLNSEKPSGGRSADPMREGEPMDLHEWYEQPNATDLSDINPEYPIWCVPRRLTSRILRSKPLIQRGFLL